MRNDLGLMSRRSTLVLASVVTGLIALAPRGAAGQDPCSQLKSLLPGSPVHTENSPPWKGKPGEACFGYYEQRVTQRSKIGGLYEFYTILSIQQAASPAAAKQMISVGAGKPVAYGDGGFEKLEGSGGDLPTPTAQEAKDGFIDSGGGLCELTGECGTPDQNYYARFTCGAYVVHVSANPTRGHTARQLIAELNANTNVCRSAAVAAVAPPIAPPVRPPVSPPAEDNFAGGTRVFEGETAGQILRAANFGSRYMAVIRREWDPAQSCFVEDRAWVSGIKGSDGGRVAVQLGPVRQVCVRGNALTSAQVNEAEVRLQYTRNEYYKALKAKQELKPYLTLSDPARVAWANGEIQKVDAWIKKYELDIAKLQAAVATSAPQ